MTDVSTNEWLPMYVTINSQRNGTNVGLEVGIEIGPGIASRQVDISFAVARKASGCRLHDDAGAALQLVALLLARGDAHDAARGRWRMLEVFGAVGWLAVAGTPAILARSFGPPFGCRPWRRSVLGWLWLGFRV